MSARTPHESSLVSTLAAHESWARTAFDRRSLDQVDPDRVLSKDEDNRRAAKARKTYFARLILRSIQARRAKAGRIASDGAA
jgi:hypothetical protein